MKFPPPINSRKSEFFGTSSSGNERWITKERIKLGDLLKDSGQKGIESSEQSTESGKRNNYLSIHESFSEEEEDSLFNYFDCQDKSSPSDNSNGNKKTTISVLFPDGTIIHRKNAADTLVDTIKRIGPERVATLKIPLNKDFLVSRNKHIKYPAQSCSVGNGLFVNTQSCTDKKIEMLEDVSARLNLGLVITKS